jgi:hypothetical protein
MGRGFGNEGGEEAVRVASHDPPEADKPAHTSRKKESKPRLIIGKAPE